MLPKHGKIACRKCFPGKSDIAIPHPNWRIINDPGNWGSDKPEYLILGFSKGTTQAGIYEHGKFEDVPFAGMRNRLTEALQVIGVLADSESIDQKITDSKSNISLGSLIRCSVSRLDEKASRRKGYRVYGCTGPLITKSFREIPEVINNCTDKYLSNLPGTVKVIVFLGNGDSYVKSCQDIILSLYPDDYKRINQMAVFANNRLWLHLAHPSGLNGHFNAWLKDNKGPGLKRREAQEALLIAQSMWEQHKKSDDNFNATHEKSMEQQMSLRTITLTDGNLNNGHIYLRSILDFFPPSSIGGENKSKIARSNLEIDWGGQELVITDIAGDKKIFRKRGWLRTFFSKNNLKAGDKVVIEKIDDKKYKIYPATTSTS
jgi:hypothetical protein